MPALLGLIVFAAAVRAVVAWRTEVPAWDGVHYLWVAERAGEGHPGALFDSVFHPGWPAVLAPFTGLGDPVVVGQVVAGLLSVGALPLLWGLTRDTFGRRAALWAAVVYAAGTWYARYPADVLSEAAFYPCVAGWAWATVRGRGGVAGLCAGLAYAVRPEGAVLALVGVVWSAARRRPGVVLGQAAGAAVPAAAVIAGWAWWGPGPMLSSKLAFNLREGVGSGGLAHWGEQLLRLPGAVFEDQGYLVVPLVAWGLWRARHRGWPWLLAMPFLVQCLVAPALKTHYRFFSGFGLLLLPFAGHAFAHLADEVVTRRAWRLALVVLLLLPDAVRWPHARRPDRAYERTLGAWLRERGVAGDELFTDQPRVAYFAGLRPPPPRRWRPEEIESAITSPDTRWLVLIPRRSGVPPARLENLGYREPTLPPALDRAVEHRGATIHHRP